LGKKDQSGSRARRYIRVGARGQAEQRILDFATRLAARADRSEVERLRNGTGTQQPDHARKNPPAKMADAGLVAAYRALSAWYRARELGPQN